MYLWTCPSFGNGDLCWIIWICRLHSSAFLDRCEPPLPFLWCTCDLAVNTIVCPLYPFFLPFLHRHPCCIWLSFHLTELLRAAWFLSKNPLQNPTQEQSDRLLRTLGPKCIETCKNEPFAVAIFLIFISANSLVDSRLLFFFLIYVIISVWGKMKQSDPFPPSQLIYAIVRILGP